MTFNDAAVKELLVKCHRRCCICHRYCGVKMEIHHIVPGGSDEIGNAIALCFDCHAEIEHYNIKHAKGRRFTPEEIKGHKKQWLRICAENPIIFASTVPPAEGGALERLLCELIYNKCLANMKPIHPAAVYEVEQFRRAIADGTLTWLKDEQAEAVNKAYALINEINNRARGITSVGHPGARAALIRPIEKLIPDVCIAIQKAIEVMQGEKT